MQGGFGAVVPGAVDARHGRDVPVDVAFRPGGLARAPVVDEPGEQSAAFAFHLRVDATFRRCRADGRVRLEMAEPAARVHTFWPFPDGRAHRDAWPLRPPALGTGAVPFASRQIPPEV